MLSSEVEDTKHDEGLDLMACKAAGGIRVRQKRVKLKRVKQ